MLTYALFSRGENITTQCDFRASWDESIYSKNENKRFHMITEARARTGTHTHTDVSHALQNGQESHRAFHSHASGAQDKKI